MDYRDEVKRTNEIKTAAPMLDAIDIAGRVITADALLTQRYARLVFDYLRLTKNSTGHAAHA